MATMVRHVGGGLFGNRGAARGAHGVTRPTTPFPLGDRLNQRDPLTFRERVEAPQNTGAPCRKLDSAPGWR